MALLLARQGQPLWCACGGISPLSLDIWSRHNSQHLVDPYSATHVLHGLAFYGLLWLVTARGRLALPWRFAAAVLLESAWELLENSEAVIRRYREATISLDYFGDSVANSLSDVAMCAAGFAIAARLRPPWAAALFVATELLLLATIRDSLVLNVIMLVAPLPGVKEWQMGH